MALHHLLLVLQLLPLTLPLLHLVDKLLLDLFLYLFVHTLLFLPWKGLFINVGETPIVATLVEIFCHRVLPHLSMLYILLAVNALQFFLHLLV